MYVDHLEMLILLQAKQHACRRNWNGSSKAMEPFLTATCLQRLKDKGMDIKRLVMDGDTSTFTRVKRNLFPSLKKSNDKNHICKNFGNELYKLKPKHKSLTAESISHIQKCFSYAISQNRSNVSGVKRSMKAIAPHMFNEHTLCSPSWCRSRSSDQYRQAHILKGDELRGNLEELMQR